VKFTVQNNAATRCDTIFPYSKGLAQYAALNFDATKVAFFRWGIVPIVRSGQYAYPDRPANQYTATYFSDSNWISVVNIDGTGLRNLVAVDWPDLQPGECCAALDWPYGDWVYYEKPTKSAEIWRVNVNNPLLHEFVVKLKGDDSAENSNFGNLVPLFLRRFSLSFDSKLCAAQMINYVNNTAFCFPPPNGDKSQCDPSDGGVAGCNISVSASGHYYGHYLWAGHCAAEIRYWDGTSAGGINAQNYQTSTYCGSELIRWSVNSDQWFMQSTSNDGKVLTEGWASGVNQSIANPVTKEKFKTSSNGSGRDNTAGDFWIETANLGKYQDWSGNWIAVQPPRPLDRTPSTAPGTPEASVTGPHIAQLTWSAASDAESGVFCYSVFRDGVFVDTAMTTGYADSGLVESHQYSWQVSTINGNGIESQKSAAALATTPADNTAPVMIGIEQVYGPTRIRIIFDEPVDATSAQVKTNYSVNNGTTVSSAALVKENVVELTVSSMTVARQYTVQAIGVADRSAAKNPANCSKSFTYEGIVQGLKYTTTLGKSGITPVIDNNLRGGMSAGIEFNGLLKIILPGEYRFFGCSFNEFAVYVNNVKLFGYGAEQWDHSMTWNKTNLTAGYVPFKVTANTDVLYIAYEGPDRIRRRIPADMLFHVSDGQPVGLAAPWPAPSARRPSWRVMQVNGNIMVRFDAAGAHTVRLLSASGRVVCQSVGRGVRVHSFGGRNIGAGLYFLQIENDGGLYSQSVVLREMPE
jgi:hypothetical protein